MGTIIASLYQDKTLNIITDSLILSGEHLTTNLLISIPSSLRDYNYYLEFLCPDDRCLSTDRLELVEGSIIFPLPYDILRSSGRIDIQLVARLESEDQLIFKSTKVQINVDNSINADDILADTFQDVICEIVTEEATESVLLCNKATTDCINATNVSFNSTNECLAVTEEARNTIIIANNVIEDSYTATILCNQATDNANNAANSVNEAISNSETAIILANEAAQRAGQAADEAINAKIEAHSAVANANSAIINTENATQSAIGATVVVNEKINDAEVIIASANSIISDLTIIKQETLTAQDNAETSTVACIEATDNSILITALAEDVINACNLVTVNAEAAIINANTAINSASIATSFATDAANLANNATGNAINATDSANQQTALTENLYNAVLYDYENNIFHGKSAYQYAIEKGYQGTEEEFSSALSLTGDYITHSQANSSYAKSIKACFSGKNALLNYCREDYPIDNLNIRAERTIAIQPEAYVSDYILPESTTLVVSAHNSDIGTPSRSLNINLPYPLYCIEGAKDEIVWDALDKQFYIIYRTRCIDLSEIQWNYMPNALPNTNTAAYVAEQFTYNINYPTPYYECGSMVNYYGQTLGNTDIEGITIYNISSTNTCIMRIPRSVCSDPLTINDFLINNRHKLIIKLNEEIRLPLSQSDNDALKELQLYSPDTYLRAETHDNEYNVSGEYHLDTMLFFESKASLDRDNYFKGSQDIEGNLIVRGSLKGREELITLRDDKISDIGINGRCGVIIKNINGLNDAKILIDKYGTVTSGLDNNIKTIAEREDNPKDASFAYWSDQEGKFMTSSNYKTTGFLKQVITDDIILAAENWIINGGKAEYQINNYNIKESSFVMVSYDDLSKEKAINAGLSNYNPVVGNDSLTLIADSIPDGNITVKLVITGV